MKVFISWSGERSRVVAELLHEFLSTLFPDLQPWMSSKSIEKGSNWMKEVGDKLSSDMLGIVCITPENQRARWLNFESGALYKVAGRDKIFPLLIGMEYEDLDFPFKHFQSTVFSKDDFLKFIMDLNKGLGELKREEISLRNGFDFMWDGFSKKVEEELRKNGFEEPSGISPKILKAFRNIGISEPMTGQIVSFKKGFETHEMYHCILENAQKRLYLFGRKNRKLFDINYEEFFSGLRGKINNGFDIKILTLDPEAPSHITGSAHRYDSKVFMEQLIQSQKNALYMLKKSGLSGHDILRKYSLLRDYSFLVVDEAVLYTSISYDQSGKPLKLTNSAFTLTHVQSDLGHVLLDKFNEVWETAKPLKGDFEMAHVH